MGKKKMSYIDLLKEAVANYPSYDTSKTTDVSGPFVDDIVSYEGDGELTTYKDASSILEKYYFDKDEGIENIHEQHEEEAAGNGDGGTIDKEKDEIVKKVTEAEEDKDEEDDEDEEEENVEESEDLSETEKSLVEKLIEEMEEEKPAGEGDAEKYIPEAEEKDEDEESDDKDNEEDEEDLDVDKELEEWGTGILEEDEMDEEEEEDEEEEKEEKKEKKEDKDDKKDKKDKKKKTNEAGPTGGPLGKNKSSGIKQGKYDKEEGDVIEEQFSLFKKQIMESDDKSDEVEDIDGKDVIV